MAAVDRLPSSFDDADDQAPLPRARLAERVRGDLEERIVTGSLAAGDHLPAEAQMASRYGVSSRVIREALGALAARGLVEVQAGKGTVVRGVDSAALRDFFQVAMRADSRGLWDLFELRKLVEVQVAELAARRATAADVEACSDALRRLEAARDTLEEYVIADVDFHQAVARASGNRMLVIVYAIAYLPILVHRTKSWYRGQYFPYLGRVVTMRHPSSGARQGARPGRHRIHGLLPRLGLRRLRLPPGRTGFRRSR